MRINQYLAAATGLSRRAADAAIAAGRVTVDGQPATLGQTIADTATVTLDHQSVTPASEHFYLMFNKPAGYVTSHARQGEDPTLYELLPPAYQQLRPVGRLDRDSSGLILLSNDGHFIHQLSHPSFGKDKIYELTFTTRANPQLEQQLAAGVPLADGPSHVRLLHANGRTIRVTISEGRNRQLRRTFGALGYTITRLHRLQVGPYELGQLAPGHWQTFQPVIARTKEEATTA